MVTLVISSTSSMTSAIGRERQREPDRTWPHPRHRAPHATWVSWGFPTAGSPHDTQVGGGVLALGDEDVAGGDGIELGVLPRAADEHASG